VNIPEKMPTHNWYNALHDAYTRRFGNKNNIILTTDLRLIISNESKMITFTQADSGLLGVRNQEIRWTYSDVSCNDRNTSSGKLSLNQLCTDEMMNGFYHFLNADNSPPCTDYREYAMHALFSLQSRLEALEKRL
jgi:hypothetical protein